MISKRATTEQPKSKRATTGVGRKLIPDELPGGRFWRNFSLTKISCCTVGQEQSHTLKPSEHPFWRGIDRHLKERKRRVRNYRTEKETKRPAGIRIGDVSLRGCRKSSQKLAKRRTLVSFSTPSLPLETNRNRKTGFNVPLLEIFSRRECMSFQLFSMSLVTFFFFFFFFTCDIIDPSIAGNFLE